jgi:hypothetical protein
MASTTSSLLSPMSGVGSAISNINLNFMSDITSMRTQIATDVQSGNYDQAFKLATSNPAYSQILLAELMGSDAQSGLGGANSTLSDLKKNWTPQQTQAFYSAAKPYYSQIQQASTVSYGAINNPGAAPVVGQLPGATPSSLLGFGGAATTGSTQVWQDPSKIGSSTFLNAQGVPDLAGAWAPTQTFSQNMSGLGQVFRDVATVGALYTAAAAGSAIAGSLGSATGAASDVAPVTNASLAYNPAALTASNVAPGAVSDSVTATADVPASISGFTPDFTGVGAVNPADLTTTLPTIPSQSLLSTLSSYQPKNLISSGLQSAGVPQPIAGAAGGAVQGAGTSALRGGNPVTGAISGGVGGAWGSGGIGADVSNAAGGGVTGSTVSGAVGGALGSAVGGGNPLLGGITGGVSGGVSGATGSGLAGNVAGGLTRAGLASGTAAPTKTGGTTMAGIGDNTTPQFGGAPNQVSSPATINSPTSTATQGMTALPNTGIPNGASSISPASLVSGTGIASAASSATAPTPTVDPAASSTAGTTPADPTSSLLSDIGTGIGAVGSALLGGNSVTSMAPYLAIGALGFSQADQAKKDAQAQADKVAALGTPYTQAGTQLLSQYQSGTLTPAQQSVVDTATSQGNTLLASDPQLQAIYTQAFGNYASGTLRPADQLALDQSVAAQKAQVRQNLSSMGITDSTILAAQDQQIDNNAVMQKQNLLDAQFATGNQAFSTWMQTTQAGQQLILEGQQYAVTSLQQTFNNALNAGQTGMNPVIQSVQMQIAADAQLGTAVSDLLGNLAKAYAYTTYQKNNAGGTTGGSTSGAKVPGASTGQTGTGGSANLLPATGAAVGMNLGLPGTPGGPSAGGGANYTGTDPYTMPLGLPGTSSGVPVNSTGGVGGGAVTGSDFGASNIGQPLSAGTGVGGTDLSGNTATPSLPPATQDTLNSIYSGSFDPSTADTSSLVNYVSYSSYT